MSDFTAQLEAEIPRLRRYALALARDPGRAEDLVQNCLLRALTNEHRWQPASDLRAWLLTILHNGHISDLRRAARERHRAEVVASLSPTHCEPKPVVDLVDLDRGIAKLPDSQRRLLLLIGVEEMTYDQAAAVLALPIDRLRVRLWRARVSLRRLTHREPCAVRDSLVASPADPPPACDRKTTVFRKDRRERAVPKLAS